MKIEGKCRVCSIPLSLTIDDEYASLETDPMGLIPLATCNRCYDYKCGRDRLEDRVGKACVMMLQHNIKKGSDQWSKLREAIAITTRRYAELVQRHNRYREVLWSEDFVNILMERPEMWWKTMGNYRIQARQHERSLKHENSTGNS